MGSRLRARRGTNDLGNEELNAIANEQPTLAPTISHILLKPNYKPTLIRLTIGNEYT